MLRRSWIAFYLSLELAAWVLKLIKAVIRINKSFIKTFLLSFFVPLDMISKAQEYQVL